MGKDVFVVADNVLSPIGKTTTENFDQLKKKCLGRKRAKQSGNFAEAIFCFTF